MQDAFGKFPTEILLLPMVLEELPKRHKNRKKEGNHCQVLLNAHPAEIIFTSAWYGSGPNIFLRM